MSGYDYDDTNSKAQQDEQEVLRRFLYLFLVAVGVFSLGRMHGYSGVRGAQDMYTQDSAGVGSTMYAATAVESKVELGRLKQSNILDNGVKDTICNRRLPFDLSDTTTWPTPQSPTPLYENTNDKGAVLIKKDGGFGGFATHISCFFHAYDVAFDNKSDLHITKDATWIWQMIFPMFLGPFDVVDKNEESRKLMEDILGITIVESENDAKLEGKEVIITAANGLYWSRTQGLTSTQIRDHRNSILRKLFRHPSDRGDEDENACSAINSLVGKKKNENLVDSKYSVVYLSPKGVRSYLGKLNDSTGHDHSATLDMTPDYVKSILQPLDMLQSDIFIIENGEVDEEVDERLFNDADLSAVMQKVPDEVRHVGSSVYLSVLADVFIGNPVDHLSLWIARMRFALGKKNTFVFTEKKTVDGEDKWVSYVNEENYLELYDRTKLGQWMA